MTPKVSVIMPVYNGEKYLRESIESILQQSNPNFEYLIIDDNSTDETASIIKSYADHRIYYFHNDQNLGITCSLNRGIALAQGEYLARMDADDISYLDRIGKQVMYLGEHPEIGVLGTAADMMDDAGKIIGNVSYPREHGILRWIMCFFENPIIHPSVMIKHVAISRVDGYDENFKTSQDYHLWYKLSKITQLANISDVTIHLRKHNRNISTQRVHEQQLNSTIISQMLIRDILKEEIDISLLHGPCRACWTPNEASLNDFIQLLKLINRLNIVFIENNNLTQVEKEGIIQHTRKRLQLIKESVDRKKGKSKDELDDMLNSAIVYWSRLV